MTHQLTPGAERAIAAAGKWLPRSQASGLESDTICAPLLEPVGLPELLLGLLDEPECRAAKMLAAARVAAETVVAEWPEFVQMETDEPSAGPRRWSPKLQEAIAAAAARLADYPQPLELATEHLLLGIVLSDSAAGHWLRDKGLDAERLEMEIHRLYGIESGPLEVDWAEIGNSGTTTAAEQVADTLPPKTLSENSPAPAADLASQPIGVLRIIDAAANRAGEGLRAVEDYTRFVLDDRHLTALAKQLRHDLAAALARVPAADRHAARDTTADVGAGIQTAAESRRADAADVAAAAFQRAQQALRSLEEYVKLWDPAGAALLESLRYRAYTLERAVSTTAGSLDRLAAARLCVLLDGRDSPQQFGRLAETLVAAGVDMLQLRDKRLDDRQLLARARQLREITRGSDALLVVNDRPDLALLARADGVHVGQDDLPVKAARAVVGPRLLIGVSTHSLPQARQAVMDGANYIGVGPTFPSGTKTFERFTGLELLRGVAAEIRLPAFAIGGIGPENLPEVLACGISRAAVSGAVLAAEDPAAAVRLMRNAAANERK